MNTANSTTLTTNELNRYEEILDFNDGWRIEESINLNVLNENKNLSTLHKEFGRKKVQELLDVGVYSTKYMSDEHVRFWIKLFEGYRYATICTNFNDYPTVILYKNKDELQNRISENIEEFGSQVYVWDMSKHKKIMVDLKIIATINF